MLNALDRKTLKKLIALFLIPAAIIALLVFGESILDKSQKEIASDYSNDSILMSSNQLHGTPLIVFDGKEVQTLNHVDCQSTKIEVLGAKEAVEKYGERGKNGAVIITSKKEEIEAFSLDF